MRGSAEVIAGRPSGQRSTMIIALSVRSVFPVRAATMHFWIEGPGATRPFQTSASPRLRHSYSLSALRRRQRRPSCF